MPTKIICLPAFAKAITHLDYSDLDDDDMGKLNELLVDKGCAFTDFYVAEISYRHKCEVSGVEGGCHVLISKP